MRITLVGVKQPQDTDLRGNGGLREIQIAGVHVRQSLRPPVLTAQALGGRDLSRVGLTYLFERTTADDPYRRDKQTGSPLLELAKNRADAEDQLDRVVFAPARAPTTSSAWVDPSVDAADSALDRLAGWRGPERFDSSGRFHDLPRHRASRAFDGDPSTSWLGIWARPAAPYPWISWTTAKPTTVRGSGLEPPVEAARHPTAVRLDWAGGRARSRRPELSPAGGRRRHGCGAVRPCAAAASASRSWTPPSRPGPARASAPRAPSGSGRST